MVTMAIVVAGEGAVVVGVASKDPVGVVSKFGGEASRMVKAALSAT